MDFLYGIGCAWIWEDISCSDLVFNRFVFWHFKHSEEGILRFSRISRKIIRNGYAGSCCRGVKGKIRAGG
jgi:hypothetical protein